MNILLHRKRVKNLIMGLILVILIGIFAYLSVDLIQMKLSENKPRDYVVIDGTK